MDPICKAIATEDLLHIARSAGATNVEGGNISTGVICFTHQEFDEFISRLFAHQKQVLTAYKEEHDRLFLSGGCENREVSLAELLTELSEKLGVENAD